MGTSFVALLLAPVRRSLRLPIASARVQAGFPSPADDYIDGKIDLNDLLIEHEAATFLVRASGDSMQGAGIFDGDLLIVDRSLEPVDGKVVIACVDGDFTCKRLRRRAGRVWLEPCNREFPAIEISAEGELQIFGVVTNRVGAVR